MLQNSEELENSDYTDDEDDEDEDEDDEDFETEDPIPVYRPVIPREKLSVSYLLFTIFKIVLEKTILIHYLLTLRST